MPRITTQTVLHLGGFSLALLLTVVLIGCGGGGDSQQPTTSQASNDGGATPPAYLPPMLTDEELEKLPGPIGLRISSAYWDATNNPGVPEKLGTLAALYYVQGYPQKAAEVLRHGAELKSDVQVWSYSIGLAELKAGNEAEALKAFEKAAELADDYLPTYIRLGRLLEKSDPEQAKLNYERALKIYPMCVQALYGLGNITAAAGETDAAKAYYGKALGLAPAYAAAHAALAKILAAEGQEAQARLHEHRAEAGEEPLLEDGAEFNLERGGLDVAAICSDAMMFAQNGDFDRAIQYAEAVGEVAPNDARPHHTLGAIYAFQGAYEKAEAELNKALELDADLVAAKSDLAQVIAELKQPEDAAKLLRECLAADPTDMRTLARFDMLMRQQEKPDATLELLREAANRSPADEVLAYRVAQYAAQANLPEESIANLQRAVALRPEFLAARHSLGVALLDIGNLGGAQEQWEAAINVNPYFIEPYFGLLSVAKQQKDYTFAANTLRRGLETVPNSLALTDALARLLATAPDDTVRSGEEAVRLAETACERNGRKNYTYLDTLAAAYAEVSRFDDAIRTIEEAIRLADQVGDTERANEFRARRTLYEQKQPYREP